MICEICKKEIKVGKYKGNTSPYTCNNDRNISHRRDRCPQILKNEIIKKNGYDLYFCKLIKKYVSIEICKDCNNPDIK